MNDLPSLISVDPGPAMARRNRLAALAKRAGCGILAINNSMQELIALASIGKAIREARAELLITDKSTPARQQDTAPAYSSDSTNSQIAAAETQSAAQPSLLENMLQTSGRVVSKKS